MVTLAARAGTVAAQLVVSLKLVIGEERLRLEVGAKVRQAQLSLELADLRHATLKIRLGDRTLAERGLEGLLFPQDRVAETLGLSGHAVEEVLRRSRYLRGCGL